MLETISTRVSGSILGSFPYQFDLLDDLKWGVDRTEVSESGDLAYSSIWFKMKWSGFDAYTEWKGMLVRARMKDIEKDEGYEAKLLSRTLRQSSCLLLFQHPKPAYHYNVHTQGEKKTA
jgi:hypothetical protein